MIGTARCLAALAVAAATLGLSAAPTLAQLSSPAPLSERDGRLMLDAQGHRFAIPLPNWLEEAGQQPGNVLAEVETHFVSDDRQAVLEILPKGEVRALWKTLYGATITVDSGRTLPQYREMIMALYGNTCQRTQTGFFQIGQDEGDVLAPLGFVCGAYASRLAAYAGEGEVMVMSFRKTDRGIAMVYQEWRGPAFDPADPATWPVKTQVVQARAQQLQADTVLTLAQ